MKYIKQAESYMLRLDPGELFVGSITDFAAAKNIMSGELRALGAIKDFELGYYLIKEKEYVRKKFEVNAEIVNAIGNLAFRDGKPFSHIHLAAGLPDFSVVGGHLFEGIVSATAEITVTPWPTKMDRKFDDNTGLFLLDLSCGETA